MSPTRIYRRVEHGTSIELTLVREQGSPFPHYIDRRFDTPLPPGWRVEIQRQPNWDGGPSLRRELRVCDTAEPFDAAFTEETMRRAEELAVALVEHLRVWGAAEPRVFVWQLDGIDNIDSAPDVLSKRRVILDELVGLEHVPAEIEDPNYAYGPNGPPLVPAALVGRPVADLRDGDPLIAAIDALGVYISFAGDEIRFALERP